ncbi:WD repeat-containing protein 34 [Phlyctochytrium bullatum]|nr:WD repeat-containing protein 34 [Phlyctochytrium bullatum]
MNGVDDLVTERAVLKEGIERSAGRVPPQIPRGRRQTGCSIQGDSKPSGDDEILDPAKMTILGGKPEFVDEATDVVSIASTWKKSRSSHSQESQTLPIKLRQSGIQTTTLVEQETLPEPIKQYRPPASIDTPAVLAFLQKIEPMMTEALSRNASSTAFDGYSVRWDDEITSITCQFTLEHIEREPEMCCTDVVWNKSGSIVGVAYGRYDHDAWCTHKGQLCCWNLNSRTLNPLLATFRMEAPTCLMAVCFHPELPNVVAGGTFNGEVIVWSLSENDDQVLAMSKMGELTHQEPISKVAWVQGSKSGVYDILTVANDGKILLWAFEFSGIKVKAGTLISKTNIPRNLKPKSDKNASVDTPIGVTAFSISKESKSDFIIGTEVGYVFKSNTSLFTKLDLPDAATRKDKAPIKYSNPIQAGFQTHTGAVNGVSFSPFHRNLFLTCGYDGTIRLFHKLQHHPLLLWEPATTPVFAVEWSPHKPSLFCVASADGHVYFYNLAVRNRSSPVQSWQVSEDRTAFCSSVAFNPNSDTVVTGCSNGVVKVWRLTTVLSTAEPVDMRMLRALGDLA